MSREIKFRGMTLNGEWAFGLVAHITASLHGVERGWFISNSVGLPCAYAVRPETVAQFTGLHDKNGKEIYEGDIVRYLEIYDPEMRELYERDKDEGVSAVEWVERGWQFYGCANPADLKYIEVIGNIHENPELLEAK